ncbi:MAG: sugar ABC transporter substrate-binding protein [Chloroflexota bacterium]|nr:sugar ABC transporter substrate-binding protein [Chloroflexota bacterium]
MQNHKFHWLLIVLVAIALALAACGGDEAEEGAVEEPAGEVVEEAPAEEVVEEEGAVEEGEEAAEPGAAVEAGECVGIAHEEGAEIVFSGWGDETEQQVYRNSIERFNEVCPGITVDYQPVPADFQTQMTAAFAGGEGPDVLYVDSTLMTSLGAAGQLLPLDPYMEEAGVTREEFIPQLLTIFTQNDQTYALPKDWGTLGLIYRPAAFEEAGIEEPTADWTWEDLQEAAAAIAENTDIPPFCQAADWNRFAPWVFSRGGTFVNEDFTEATLTDPAVIEAATIIDEMENEGLLVSPGDVGASWCGEAIGKELVAMTLEGGWMVNFMRQDYPDVEWSAVPIPEGPEGPANIIFTNGIGVNAGSDYPAAAAAFTIFVTGRENQAAITETGFAYPTREDQLELIENPIDQAISEGGTYELTRVAYMGPNTGPVGDAISQALERIYLDDQEPEEAFQQAQEEAQMALQ